MRIVALLQPRGGLNGVPPCFVRSSSQNSAYSTAAIPSFPSKLLIILVGLSASLIGQINAIFNFISIQGLIVFIAQIDIYLCVPLILCHEWVEFFSDSENLGFILTPIFFISIPEEFSFLILETASRALKGGPTRLKRKQKLHTDRSLVQHSWTRPMSGPRPLYNQHWKTRMQSLPGRGFRRYFARFP